MSVARTIRILFIAGVAVFVCHAGGVFAFLLIGVFLPYLIPRTESESRIIAADDYFEFLPWLICVVFFAMFALIPTGEFGLNGNNVGLAILSPPFGVMVYIYDRAISHLFTKHTTVNHQ